jgi:hypothetical protein
MDSPFVTFLGVEIPYAKAQDQEYIDSLRSKLDNPTIRERYQISKYSFVSYWTPYFSSTTQRRTLAKVRAIDTDNELYKFIYEKGLITSSQAKDLSTAEWSIIVTERFLKKLGYSKETYPAYLNYVIGFSRGDALMPIPIAAIVSQLPNECDMFVTWKLYEAFERRYGDSNPLFPDQSAYKNQQRFFIPNQSEQTIKAQFKPETAFSIIHEAETFETGVILEIIDSNGREEHLTELQGLFGKDVIEVYNFNAVGYSVETDRAITFDNLIVQFDKLDEINEFESYMLADPIGLSIDMNDIEARNNFLLFSKISRVLSSVLTLISIAFIVTFLTRTITEHIDRNAKNLGTLKAFGLSNKNIAWTYSGISGVLILCIFIGALLLVFVSGELLTNFILRSIGVKMAKGETLFILPFNFLMILYFVFMPLVLITTILYLKIRRQTPGDLIYER